MFRGYFVEDDDGKPTEEITSWQGWKVRLRETGEVWDEYERKIDTEEFIARVEATPIEERRRSYDTVTRHRGFGFHGTGVAPGFDWLDEDQFSFYGGEFS